MIRFVDIETGNVFNGEYPYIFWMNDEQGVNLIYNKPICFISHSDKVIVELPNNNVFKLLNLKSWQKPQESTLLAINDFQYTDISDLIEDTGKMEMTGVKYNNFYVYMFYVMAQASVQGEYLENFYLYEDGTKTEYKLGGDFYGENEFNHINLLNNGIDIPDTIQKALYPTNVHEDKKDNIVLNRKWKELLSNYWDIIANKGSYKSLYNSLKWFEYGDILKLFEIWKHDDNGKTVYDERSVAEILSDKYFETLNGFAKTTYLAISCALERIVKEDGEVQYDSEKNPQIEKITHEWSINDLSLKLSMLGSFYKTYFLPIHIDCIRTTIEDIIYSNTIKLQNGSVWHREDTVDFTKDIKCNVKNNDIFRIENVSIRVGRDTMFGHQYNNWEDYNIDIVGVQRKEPYFYDDNQEEQLKTYYAQYFNAIGSIVDFDITIPLMENDFIKNSSIAYKSIHTGEWKLLEDKRIIKDKQIKFSLLFTKTGTHDIRLQFDSFGGYIYTKRIVFNVIDTESTTIKVYKIQNMTIPDINSKERTNDYVFGRMLGNHYRPIEPTRNTLAFKQYLPAKNIDPYKTMDWDYKGICLNHFIIFKDKESLENDRYIKKHYFTQLRVINEDLVYTICLSKRFGFKPNYSQISRYKIYREEYIFYPKFHELVELGLDYEGKGERLENHIITDEDALCVIPSIPYGSLIEEAQWEFINTSNPNMDPIIPTTDISEPFVAPGEKTLLKPGYYNIVFRYKLAGESKTNTLKLNSAFLKK